MELRMSDHPQIHESGRARRGAEPPPDQLRKALRDGSVLFFVNSLVLRSPPSLPPAPSPLAFPPNVIHAEL